MLFYRTDSTFSRNIAHLRRIAVQRAGDPDPNRALGLIVTVVDPDESIDGDSVRIIPDPRGAWLGIGTEHGEIRVFGDRVVSVHVYRI